MNRKNGKISVLMIIMTLLMVLSLLGDNVYATTDRIAWNYANDIPEYAWNVNDNTNGDLQNLRVTYNMGEGPCIIRGVSYLYYNFNPDTGSYAIGMQFEGDSFWVGYSDLTIPHSDPVQGINYAGRIFRCGGPTYLIDDDPAVNFIGLDPSHDSIAICADDTSYGHTYYDQGSGWVLQPISEIIVQLIYEWIISFNAGETKTGSFTGTDNLDAYFLSLTAGTEYKFQLDRTSGTGDFDMRLVTYQDLTNDDLVQSSGSTYPKSMTYTAPSTATYVLLVESDSFSDVADYSITYFENFQPIANFTANETTIIESESVQFTYNGYDGNTPATYLWDFGDLSPTSTDQNPIHQYTTAGLYTVTLAVTDDDGDFDNEIKIDYIDVEADIFPFSDFIGDETNISQGEYVQFTFIGTQGNAPATYLWDFGDGTPTSDLQNPLHQYLSVDVYNISLNVTDKNGDEDSLVKYDYITVNLNEIPISNFTANETIIVEWEEIQFNFTGIEGTVPAAYQWDFGDGSPNSIVKDPIHQYNLAGNYTVSLNVTDNNGDSDVETKVDYITVNPDEAPIANFTANKTIIKEGDWIQYNFTGIEGTVPASYQWDFGDSSPISIEKNPIHQYNLAGNYTVSLNVTDNNGDSDIETKVDFISVNIDLFPNSSFNVNNTFLIGNGWVQFTFTGENGDPPATYFWNFGDGSPTSSDENPTHYYSSVGNYTVSLTVTDDDGDIDVETKTNLISVVSDITPTADFIADNTNIEKDDSVLFTFLGTEGNMPATYQWDFGDGSLTSNAQNPNHQYTTAGTYTVTLVVTDANGDFDTEIKLNYIVVEEFQMTLVINSPQMNDIYAQDAPAYSITVSGVDIHTMWYTLDDGLTNITFTEFSWIIDQSAWDSLSEGHISIHFYVQDTSRGTIDEEVIVVKVLPPPPVIPTPRIPGYNLIIIIGSLPIISIIMIKRFKKHVY